jgi:DNA polymerase-3 subunit epsilon
MPMSSKKKEGESAIKLQKRGPLKVIKANEQELAEHQSTLERLDKVSGGECIWLKGVDNGSAGA